MSAEAGPEYGLNLVLEDKAGLVAAQVAHSWGH